MTEQLRNPEDVFEWVAALDHPEMLAAPVHAALADQALASLRQAGTTLDLIWSNPPVRIGKKALHALLTTWLGLLSEQGQAWLVVQRNLGADSLAAWLRAEGWQATRASSSKGYRVLRVTR